MWHSNQLGWFTLQVIREKGTVIYGKDLRQEIPTASRVILFEEISTACQTIRQHGRGGGLHSLDWLLTAARLLLWLEESRLGSKSEAADWGHVHARGAWRELMPRAQEIRLHPELVSTLDGQEWLKLLTEPIREAGAELESELLAQGCRH